MIDALITGKLHGPASQRTSRNGNTFTTAKLRVHTGDESTFCNVIAFDQGTQDALLALAAGEAVALAGELKVSTWTDKNGVTRPGLDLVASKALTQYHLTKRRRTMQAGTGNRQQGQHDGGTADHADDDLDSGGPLVF